MKFGIPFVTTYHLKVKELEKFIRNLLPFLYSDGDVQRFFSLPPIVSYRSARKIKDYIMRSKLYLLKERQGAEGVVVLGVKFVRA